MPNCPMPLTNPWLAGPAPDRDLPRELLEECILEHVERGRRLDEPPTDPLTVITPARIVYTEHWLRRDGYRPRQVWRRPVSPPAP